MMKYAGFSSGKTDYTPIPDAFFSDIFPHIEDMSELKVTLYFFWFLDTLQKEPRYLSLDAAVKDEKFSSAFGETSTEREKSLQAAFLKACERGTLVSAVKGNEEYYFLNSPRGRAARDGMLSGGWNPEVEGETHAGLTAPRPNIFTLYEQNIGPLTPILSETLQDAEKEYPVEWIDEAIRIAVKKNVRNWRFVEAILRSWKEKGRDETDRRTAQEDRKRDSEGKFADFINH